MTATPLLEVKGLTVAYDTAAGQSRAVDHISFSVARGEVVAIVGESGSGKSNAMLAVMRLIQAPGKVVEGEVLFDGRNLLQLSPSEMHTLRGNRFSMVFQDPMTALNPLLRVGDQVADILRQHIGLSRAEARGRSVELLQRVGIADAAHRLRDYPHQLSGGMRQRVMIAMALACDPELIIADEPTTALDVTIQAQIIQLVRTLQQQLGTAVVWITHDLGVVASLADRVIVMYAGGIVESAPVARLYQYPAHPYTAGLLASLPKLNASHKSRLQAIDGTPPNAIDMPQGCAFSDRCPYSVQKCRDQRPTLVTVAPGHESACWLVGSDAKPAWQQTDGNRA